MTTTTTDELLTLGQALLLADVSQDELIRAIETGRLPRVLAPYESGSHEPRLRIERADLERFAGYRFHGGENRDLATYAVISTCDTRDCTRYAPDGSRCQVHGGRRIKLPRELTSHERTAYHEAGHTTVARELGWTVRGTTIVAKAGAFGHCIVEPTSNPDTLSRISDYLAFSLAGPIAASMAKREDWRKLDLNEVLASEENDDDYLLAARNVRFGGDFAAAREWLEQETAKAGDRAHAILERSWIGVAADAIQLLKDNTIDG